MKWDFHILRFNLKKNQVYVILLCLTLLLIIDLQVFLTFHEIMETNDNHFAYTLDDLYIHLAIAKNFINHMIWGVTPVEFTSSSSSILYPLLISFIWIVGGINEFTPLWINIISSNILIIGVFRLFLHQNFHPLLIFFIESILLFILPIKYLIFTGLEHVLFCVLLVFLMDILAVKLQKQEQSFPVLKFQILSIIFVSLRYESLFLFAAIFVTLIYFRKGIINISWYIISASPVAVYGLVSLYNGWGILPNSLTSKTNLLNFNITVLSDSNTYLMLIFFVLVILVGIFNIFKHRGHKTKIKLSNSGIWTIIFIISLIIHLLLGRLSYYLAMYRYECYLIILSIFCLSINLRELYKSFYSHYSYILSKKNKRPDRFESDLQKLSAVFFISVFIFCIIPINSRIIGSHRFTISASRNVYVHYYYPALFCETYYNTSTGLLIHDIGYITFLSECRIYDYNFLGSLPLINGQTFTENLYNENFYIAILWPQYYNIPTGWISVAIYHIEESTIFTPHEIYYCASNLTEGNILKQHLQDFEPVLPDTVWIEYLI